MYLKLFRIILLSVVPFFLHGQIYVEEAIGRWEVSRDVTPSQAEQKALLEAKREALRIAGVYEQVNSVSLSIQTADSLYFDNFFTEISTLQINGQVKILSQHIEDVYEQASQKAIKIAVISAEIMLPTEQERLSSFKISGLNNTYRSGEALKFSIIPGEYCFFHMFIFDSTGGNIFFPNPYEKGICFSPDITYLFPTNKLIEYSIEKDSNTAKYEQNILLIVATRKKNPYIEEVTIKNVFEWLYKIPSTERYEELFSFLTE